MLSVTFNQPIVIDAANLHSLLSLANTPAVVAPYLNGVEAVAPVAAKRTRNAKPAADTGAPKAKRVRRTKAQMEEARLAAAGGLPTGAGDPPADPAPDPAPVDPAPVAETKAAAPAEKPPAKKRDRRSAAKKAADAAAEAAAAKKTAPAKKPAADKKPAEKKGGAPTADSAQLLERFAKLIDSDFDAASAILEGFGVKRFSELAATEYAAFDAKLTEAGV